LSDDDDDEDDNALIHNYKGVKYYRLASVMKKEDISSTY
jgi:hypothetical protein